MTAVRPAKSRFTLWTAIALLAAVVALGLPQSALAAPQQPTNLTATALDHDTVSLTWSHPDPASVDHYHIISRRLGLRRRAPGPGRHVHNHIVRARRPGARVHIHLPG